MGPTVYATSLFIFSLLGITGAFTAILAFSSGWSIWAGLAWLFVAALSVLAIIVTDIVQRVFEIEARLDEEEEE
ncbi:hypothetical protein [Shouchella patagoniensis]|uniref:hypothetical protein n=1 Tax=Shouchella patagoniensis TaxID=228576 RepID=UPI000995385B|nr:hypothetical protein [Shouchella patagoniensis]